MINIRFSVLVLGVVLSGPAAQGQTLSDALDTPDLAWTPAGAVTALNDPALAHDGVDAVRLEVFRSPETGVFQTSISTQLAVPSVVEFWHRSEGLDAVTVLGINNIPSDTSSLWRLKRMVAPAGRLEISNKGEPGAGPLYLDSVKARPAALVGLAEALDWPGTVEPAEFGSPGAMLGVAEGWLAPDGVDAVYFSLSSTYIETAVSGPGPALLSYRSGEAEETPGVQPLAGSDGSALPEFYSGGRTWFRTPAAGTVRFQRRPNGALTPVMDGLEMLPPVAVREALDAPGLNLTLTGAAAGTSRIPAGASDGDAVLCLRDPVADGPGGGRITLTVPGPAVVRFEYLGTGQCIVRGGWNHVDSTVWRTGEFKVYGASETITWQGGLWVNAVSVQSLAPGGMVAELLNAPGLEPEFPVPVYLEAVPGSTEGDEALSIRPVSPEASMDPVIRLPFQGPSVVSLWVSGAPEFTRLRIDGGPWRRPNRPFTAVVPGEGAHFLEMAGPAVLDRFQTVPLEEVPLEEALDAPGMVFTTFPGTPWKGYKVPESMGLTGGHGATGGQPAEGGESWIETRVEGPGVLEFRLIPLGLVSIDGGSPQYMGGAGLNGAPGGIPLGAGPHTVRWIHKGGQAQPPLAATLWLDRVSFIAGIPSLSEALDTPGRSWTAHGAAGEVLPAAWAGGSPDGVDSLQLRSIHAWVETVVNLPALVNFTGSNLRVTDGTGKVIVNQGQGSSATPSYFRQTLSGTGPALLRFSPSEDGASVLDQVEIFEATDRIAPAAVSAASGIEWRSVDGKPWSILSNPVTGEARYAAGNPVWMEAVVNGPCLLFSSPDMTLPDHGNRKVFDGRIHYPGPQRVLVARKSESGAPPVNLFSTDGFRPPLNLAESMKVPGLTWTSGGDAPWMSVSEGAAVSAPVWPGEVSWIEAELTGPGVLRWELVPGQSNFVTMAIDVLCDGVAMASSGYLHLTPGPHRVRWQASHRRDGVRNAGDYLRLAEVGWTPQPAGSVTEILGSSLNLSETLPYGPNFSAPVMEPWPAARGWRAGSDPATGAPVLEADHDAGFLTTAGPVPGMVSSQLKMERNGPLGNTVITALPAAAAPFPWTTWTAQAPVWPLVEGYRTSAAGVVFTPFTPISVGEALDQPGLDWTADSNPPGLWKALTGVPLSENSDPDGLYLYDMAMGNTAWLETTVTGPLDVSTQFGKSSARVEPGFSILLDGVPVADDSRAGSIGIVRVPAGSHRLRWEVAPTLPLPAGRHAVIRGITTAPGGPLPDINALLDAPDLKWGLIGAVPTAVTGADAHDGVDALSLGTGTGGRTLTMALEGPGILSFWMKGSRGLGEPLLDGLTVPLVSTTPPTPLTAWRKITLPIPAGTHTCLFRGPGMLDEFNWRPLPSLTPEEALDAPPGVTVTLPHPNLYGAAAWPEFSDDDTDSLLIMPGQARRLEVTVPPLSTLSLRVRAVFGSGTFGFQDLDSWPTSTTWATRTFSTRADAGITTVYLRASLAPALIDRLTVTTPPVVAGAGYFPWADGHGLATARNQPLDDPDGDGWSNLLEYSLDLDPTAADSAKAGTDTVPGTPETAVWTDPATGLTYPEIRYWRRNGQTATVETAQDPEAGAWMGDAAGWTPSPLPGAVTAPGPEGWSRVVWRSPEPVAAGGRVFVRVRYSAS